MRTRTPIRTKIPRIPSKKQLDAMTEMQYKVFENRLRHSAQRQGLRLVKSRRRDPRATDYATYMLVDVDTNAVVAMGLPRGYGLGLDDVARALWEA